MPQFSNRATRSEPTVTKGVTSAAANYASEDFLWGQGTNRFLFRTLVALSFSDGFFMWMSTAVWTLHMTRLGFAPSWIAICYALGQFVRFLGAVTARWYVWWIPILYLGISSLAVVPPLIYPDNKFANLSLCLQRIGDMLPFHYAMLGALVNRFRCGGISPKLDEQRTSLGASLITSLWVLGYCASVLLSGFIYDLYGLRPLMLLHLIGFSLQLSVHVYLRCAGHSYGDSASCAKESDDASRKGSVVTMTPVSGTSDGVSDTKWPALLWTLIIVFPVFFHAAPVCIWQYFAILYNDKFGVKPRYSCIVHVAGDALGSMILAMKDNKQPKKLPVPSTGSKSMVADESQVNSTARFSVKQIVQWCFREPHRCSFLLLLLGMCMICMGVSQSLPVVVIAHIGTGVIYVVLSQIAAKNLLVFVPTVAEHKRASSLHMSSVMLIKAAAGLTVPFMYAMYSQLPFAAMGCIGIFGGVIMAICFADHIARTYAGERWCSLSTSIYELEIFRRKSLESEEMSLVL